MEKDNNLTSRWQNYTILGLRILAIAVSAAVIIIWRTLEFDNAVLFDGLIMPIGAGLAVVAALAIGTFVIKTEGVNQIIVLVGDLLTTGLFTYTIDAAPVPSATIVLVYAITGLLYLGPIWGAFYSIAILALAPGIGLYLADSNAGSSAIDVYKNPTLGSFGALLLVYIWVVARDRYDPKERVQMKQLVNKRAEEMQDIQDRTNAIAEMTNAMTGSLNFEAIIHAALDIGLNNLRKRREWRVASIALLFRDDDRLYIADQIGLMNLDDYRTFNGDAGLIGEALDKATPIVATSALNDPILGELGLKTMRSIVALPLHAQYDNYGVLIFTTEQPNAFSKDHVHSLNAITMQATVSLQNAVLFNSLAEEKARIIEMEQDARKALVRDLHDVPTQTVAAVKMRLSIVRRMIETKSGDNIEGELQEIEKMAQRATEEIRHVLFKLRPLALEGQGMTAALNQLADKMQKTFKQNVVVKIPPEVDDLLTENQAGTLFYLIEEAATNARKYAEAELISIQAAQQGNVIAVRIADNGKGFDQEGVTGDYDNRGSFGLVNMRERAELLDGTLSMKSEPGKGTVITVMIPLKSKTEAGGKGIRATQTRLAVSARDALSRMRYD